MSLRVPRQVRSDNEVRGWMSTHSTAASRSRRSGGSRSTSTSEWTSSNTPPTTTIESYFSRTIIDDAAIQDPEALDHHHAVMAVLLRVRPSGSVARGAGTVLDSRLGFGARTRW